MTHDKKFERIYYIDQLRVLAILGVVCCHVALLWIESPLNSFNKDIFLVFNILGRYGVPIFLMLSGVLLLNKNYKIYDFLKKRFPRVLLPFIFWMMISIILTVILDHKFHFFNSFYTGINFIFTSFLTSRWYVWMLIGVYLVLPIINDFVKNKGLKGVEYYLILWFITSTIFCICLYYNVSTYFLDLSFFIGPLGYVLLGYYLHNKKFNISSEKLMIIGILLFIIPYAVKTILCIEDLFPLPLFRYYIFLKPSHLEIDLLTILQTAGIFLFVKYFNSDKINEKVHNIANFLKKGKIEKFTLMLSKSSYGIYLNHYLFLEIIGIMNLKLLGHNALKWIPFLTIVILISCWILILILSKIPFMKKFTGYY